MVDSHAHLADEAFSADVEAVVQRARAASLTGILCIVDASDPEEIGRADNVLSIWDGLRTTSGVHPHRAAPFAGRPNQAAELTDARIQAEPLVRAVGEVGLDYHYDFAPRDVQRAVFAGQVRLACEDGYRRLLASQMETEARLASKKAAEYIPPKNMPPYNPSP